MTYAITCQGCGYVEGFAYESRKDHPLKGTRTTTPLTPQGHVPVMCPQCGAQKWKVPASKEDIAKYEATQTRLARAAELCRTLDIDGLLKVPEDIRASAEVKNALSNLFAPLEGEVLKAAQANALRIARSGVSAAADVWVEMYDRAIQKAIKEPKGAKVTA
jgi:hypothetical protein